MREPYSVRKSDTHRARVKMLGLARQNVSCARAPDVQSAAVFPPERKAGEERHAHPPSATARGQLNDRFSHAGISILRTFGSLQMNGGARHIHSSKDWASVIERLLTSSPNYFIRDLKQLQVHGCTATRQIVVDDENPIFWIFLKSYKFQQWSQEAGNYTIYCGFFLSLTCIYHIWNEFKFSPGKLKILIFGTFWDFEKIV